jgi:predicted nucleotidyltransferase
MVTMNNLDASLLPDLPQKRFLLRVLAELWQDPAVVCLWLTGSLVRGTADIYSDVDLGVAVQPAVFHPDILPTSAQLLVVMHR